MGLSQRWVRAMVAFLVALPMVVAVGEPVASAQSGAVVISEIFYNPDGQSEGEEFVKLTNNSPAAIDVSGWYFSTGLDFTVPAGTPAIAAGGHFVVAKDAVEFANVFGPAPDGVFANGSTLSNSGETLTLRNAAAALVDAVTYDDLAPWPTAADGDGKSLQLYDLNLDNALASSWVAGNPSPGGANNPDLSVIFSSERGWYQGNVQVTLTPSVPGATVYYGFGTANVSTVYSGPITVSDNGDTQTLRARAVAGGQQGSIDVHTYVFRPDRGLPTVTWWDAGVTPVSGDTWAGMIEFIPPPSTGLVASAEYAGRNRNSSASQGGYGPYSEKIYFRDEYGAGRWNVDLFSDFFYGAGERYEPEPNIDQLFLRNNHHDASQLKQMIAHDTMLEMGHLAPHGRTVDFMMQGQHEGPRHLQERPETGFMSAYLGGDKADWQAEPWAGFGGSDALIGASPSNLPALEQQLNIDHEIDWLLVQWHHGGTDYWAYKNWRAAGPLTGAGDGGDRRWLWMHWDLDFGYAYGYNGDWRDDWHYSTFGARPTGNFSVLTGHASYRLRFENRVQCHLVDSGGLLTAPEVLARMDARRIQALEAHALSATHLNNLNGFWGAMTAGWPQVAVDASLNWYRNSGRYPQNLDAVNLSVSGSTLTISNPNTGQGHSQVWFMLDGSDPRRADGTKDPAAVQYVSGVALPAGRTEVIARSFNPSTNTFGPACNEPKTFDVAVGANEPLPVINEIHYNPAPDGTGNDPQLREWVEIHNPATTDYAMSGVTFSDGVNFTFPNVTIPAGGYYVIADDAAAFTAEYGFAPDAEFGGNLDNGGELLRLLTASGATMDQVTYNDVAPWATAPDGTGPSLSLIDPLSNNALAASWDASATPGGTPGAVNDTGGWILGDVRCDGAVDITDAHHTMLYVLNAKQAHNGCPLPPGGNHINVDVADVDSNGSIEPPDALFIAQCTLGATNPMCP